MKHVFLIMVLVLFVACDDIIEVEDISTKTVNILAPTESSMVNTIEVVFSWEPLQEAEDYHLQIAKPSFENATQIEVDTVLSKLNYSKTLIEGDYQWRIRAENSDYTTAYTTVSFSIAE